MADLSKADLMIIRQVHSANAEFGMVPFLLAPRWMKRAKALADRGLLKAGDCKLVPNPEGWEGYITTQAGIAAYNAQVGAAVDSKGTKR